MTAEWNGDIVRLRGRVEPEVLRPGGHGRLIVEAAIRPGGHIEAHEPPDPYLIPTVLEVLAGDQFETGPVVYPAPQEVRLGESEARLRVLEGEVRFEVPIVVAGSANPGPRTITAHLRYQACLDGACFPPETRIFPICANVG